MVKILKYRIYPTKQQIEILNKQFSLCRWLYNCALEHRVTAYKNAGKNISYYNQCSELPLIKEQFCDFKNIHSQVLQNVLKRVEISFKNFFRRVKLGNKTGFPRFKSKERFNSINYPQSGFCIIGNRVRISKLGDIKIKLHRKIEGEVKRICIKNFSNQWHVIFTTTSNEVSKKNQVYRAVGIDLGIESFAILSDGGKIQNPRYLKKSEERMKKIKSKHSKYKGNQTRLKLSVLHRKISNQRNDFLHKQSRMIVDKYGLIAYEDLNIRNMVDGRFAKSIHDAGWGKFINMIKYKAESAGVYAIAVNPRNTSKICSGCGTIVQKKISDRQHDCPVCNLSIHRDLNASINILRLGTDLRNSVSEVNEIIDSSLKGATEPAK